MSTVTLSVTIPQSILADILTHWTDEKQQVGVIGLNPMGPTDTTLTMATAAAPGQSSRWDTLLIDGEPMPIVKVDGAVVTVQRNAIAQIPAAAHASGAVVYVLTHATLYDLWFEESGKPWVLGIVGQLAAQNRSNTILPAQGTVAIA